MFWSPYLHRLLSLYLLMACLQCKCVCFDRMFGDGMIPLPHIYGARIKGVEVFCPLDPPPPYEAVASQPAAQVLNHIVIICHLLLHNHICQKALSIYSIYSWLHFNSVCEIDLTDLKSANMALCPGPTGLHWQQLNQIQSLSAYWPSVFISGPEYWSANDWSDRGPHRECRDGDAQWWYEPVVFLHIDLGEELGEERNW